jgi:hypothetical protein
MPSSTEGSGNLSRTNSPGMGKNTVTGTDINSLLRYYDHHDFSIRCNQRNRSRQAGRDVILPCSFPPREESGLEEISYDFLELPAEAREDVSFSFFSETPVPMDLSFVSSLRSTLFCSTLLIYDIRASHTNPFFQSRQICRAFTGMLSLILHVSVCLIPMQTRPCYSVC